MKKLISWVGAAAILVIIFGSIYVVVQQAQRNDANWPQIQMAEDTATALNNGASPSSLTSRNVNMQTSLAPFTIIYDKSGRVVSGSGYLNNRIPAPPFGVLTASNGHGYSWVSWQLSDNVRIAAVTTSANKYYVLSGRSLKQVEINENQTLQLSLLGGILSLIVLATIYFLNQRKTIKRKI